MRSPFYIPFISAESIRLTEAPAKLSLVGNKTDLEHRRAVRIEKHNKFAEQHGMTSHYVSAKTGDSVTLMFRCTFCSFTKITKELENGKEFESEE
uniref:Ras family protein n=1 Tax=Ascaris lumbricoides TaxID=6252 RepID=A0A0M3HGQ2_ASCLU